MMNRKEVAEFLGIHPHSVWRLHKAGKLPAVKVGGRLRFSMRDVVQALEPAGV